jgi:hypothetical protein
MAQPPDDMQRTPHDVARHKTEKPSDRSDATIVHRLSLPGPIVATGPERAVANGGFGSFGISLWTAEAFSIGMTKQSDFPKALWKTFIQAWGFREKYKTG